MMGYYIPITVAAMPPPKSSKIMAPAEITVMDHSSKYMVYLVCKIE